MYAFSLYERQHQYDEGSHGRLDGLPLVISRDLLFCTQRRLLFLLLLRFFLVLHILQLAVELTDMLRGQPE